MTTLTRDAIFISHANPEDNEFTVWLGAQLTAAGYEVWADVLRLRGGQDWQRLLEDALRNKTCKVLLVGTEHGVRKQGVRNEIQGAGGCVVGRLPGSVGHDGGSAAGLPPDSIRQGEKYRPKVALRSGRNSSRFRRFS